MHRASLPRRHGTTLPEMLAVLTIIAVLATLVLPSMKRGYDRIQTRGAAREVAMMLFIARSSAIALGRRTAAVLDARRGRVTTVAGRETLGVRPVGAVHGVRLTATRDSMTYYPDGLGLGGANLSIVLSRGAAADTVIVSREGRVKIGARAR